MTSKEAFEKIIELCNYYQHTIEKDTEVGTIWGYPIDNIRKDLEVLDILKKWIVVNETYDDLFPYEIKLRNGYVSNKSCLVFTKDDYEKVKEWLENDK